MKYPGLHGTPLLDQIETDFLVWSAGNSQPGEKDRLVRLPLFSSTGERLLFRDDAFAMPGHRQDCLVKHLANRILADGLRLCSFNHTGIFRGFPLARKGRCNPVEGAKLVTSVSAKVCHLASE